MLHRKSLAENYLVLLFIAILSFLLILGVIKVFVSRAEDVTAETICRGSIAARAKFSPTPLGQPVAVAPILCKTIAKEVPVKGDSPIDVQKDLAELTKRCWWQFGNGYVDNVFHVWFGSGVTSPCFVCYTVKIKNNAPTVRADAFDIYLSETQITKKQYDEKAKEVKDVELYTYRQYVESAGGPGGLYVSGNIGTIEPGLTYAVAFVSPDFLFGNEQYKRMMTGIVNEYTMYNFILFEELDKIREECEIMEDVSGG